MQLNKKVRGAVRVNATRMQAASDRAEAGGGRLGDLLHRDPRLQGFWVGEDRPQHTQVLGLVQVGQTEAVHVL